MEDIKIGMELHSLNHLIRRYFEFSSQKNEIEATTGNNGWIIGYLLSCEGKDVYQKDIEDRFSITRSTVSRVLSLMEQKGLIERKAVANDARLKKIVLTKKAMKVAELMKENAEKMDKKLVDGFSDEEIRTLYSYIQRMKNNIS